MERLFQCKCRRRIRWVTVESILDTVTFLSFLSFHSTFPVPWDLLADARSCLMPLQPQAAAAATLYFSSSLHLFWGVALVLTKNFGPLAKWNVWPVSQRRSHCVIEWSQWPVWKFTPQAVRHQSNWMLDSNPGSVIRVESVHCQALRSFREEQRMTWAWIFFSWVL